MVRVVVTNVPEDKASDIARALVDQRVAACVNILGPIASVYRWEGKVVEEAERTLVIKTTAARVTALRDALVAIHPYKVPEILSLQVLDEESHHDYIQWVCQEVSPLVSASA